MAHTLYQTAKLLREWHFTRLSSTEKKFITNILDYAGDGSPDPSDSVLMADNQVTKRMAVWLKKIGKRFLIN